MVAAVGGLIVVVGLAVAGSGASERASATDSVTQAANPENSVLQVGNDVVRVASDKPAKPSRFRGCVGNRIWDDRDGDGIQERGEPSIKGVTVGLWDEAGVLVSERVAANGYFSLCGPVGNYRLAVEVPEAIEVRHWSHQSR